MSFNGKITISLFSNNIDFFLQGLYLWLRNSYGAYGNYLWTFDLHILREAFLQNWCSYFHSHVSPSARNGYRQFRHVRIGLSISNSTWWFMNQYNIESVAYLKSLIFKYFKHVDFYDILTSINEIIVLLLLPWVLK